MHHLQVRDLAFDDRQPHPCRLDHAPRRQKRLEPGPRIREHDLLDADLRGPLEIPFRERIDDHCELHAV